MFRSIGRKFVLVVVGIIATISVYVIIGICVNAQAVVIYDAFPEEFYCYPQNPNEGLSCSIRNNAPISLPFINPFYSLHITIVDSEKGEFAYFIGLGGKEQNFTNSRIDLGKIDPGNFKEIDFFLHTVEGNVTFRIDVYLYNRIKVASSTYFVEYRGDYKYRITKQ